MFEIPGVKLDGELEASFSATGTFIHYYQSESEMAECFLFVPDGGDGKPMTLYNFAYGHEDLNEEGVKFLLEIQKQVKNKTVHGFRASIGGRCCVNLSGEVQFDINFNRCKALRRKK